MIAVSYHADLKEVQSDEELARLLGVDASASPFDRLAWWEDLVSHCGIDPLIAVAREGDTRAVLPMMSTGGRIEALANWYSFHVRPVLTPGANRADMLTAIAQDLQTRTKELSLSGIPDEDGSADAIATAFRKAGWVVLSQPCDSNHILELNGRSYAEYLEGRPGALRTTLKRKARRLECEVHDRFDEALWAQYEAVYEHSWKPAEGSPQFLRSFACRESAAGRSRLGLARHQGETVAAQLWTVDGGTAYIHKLAYLESAREHSPGTVLSAAMFERAIDHDKVATIDFGTGDDGYKRDWMEQVRQRYRLDMFRPDNLDSLTAMAKAFASRLARRAKHG